MGEWQPIDTASKNGPPIRVKRGTLEATVQWCVWLDDWVLGTAPIRQGERYEVLAWEPTHWTKL
jgi:hypothetical protein